MKDVHAEVEQSVREFISKLTDIIQRAAMDAISEALGKANAAVGAKRESKAAPRAQVRTAGRRGIRSPDQIAATLDRIVAYVKEHPNVRSEVVRKELQLAKPVALDAFKRLRNAKRIKMKGTKNAATYSAA